MQATIDRGFFTASATFLLRMRRHMPKRCAQCDDSAHSPMALPASWVEDEASKPT
jgi:hypothetical protein